MKQNLTKIKFALVCATTVIIASCGSKYEKTASGLTYKIEHGKSKDKIKQGQIVKFNIEYKLTGKKDSILNSTFGKMPGYLKVDSGKLMKYNFPEFITKLSVGDKAEFVLNIDSLKKKGQIPDYDKMFVKGGIIKGRLEVLKVFADDKAVQPDYEAEMKKEETRTAGDREKQMKEMKAKQEKEFADFLSKNKSLIEKQTAALKEYASKNNIKTVQTPLGALVEITTEGTGTKAIAGSHAKLMYRGYLVNGKVFDANMGIDAKHKDPIDVAVGMHNTIPGFEDCIKYFAKGGKGRFLIPAALAYGDKDNQEIPANSNLIFDIEVVDVVTETAAPATK